MIESINTVDVQRCPSCDERKTEVLFSAGTSDLTFEIIKCTKCGLARTSPFPTDEILDIYDMAGYYGSEENKFIPIVQNIRNRLMEIRAGYYLSMISCPGKPKILDIGCAEGRLLKSFLSFDCQCFGVEHPSYPSDRFLDADRIKYYKGDLNDLDLEDNSFDLIFLWHVLEHMDNPSRVLERVHDLLSPGGLVIVSVPNFSSPEATAFKESWFHLDIPWHKFHFTQKSLEYLVTKSRFKMSDCSTLCLEQGPYGTVQSLLNILNFPHNSLYEAIKGNIKQAGSAILLILQVLLAVFLTVPAILLNVVMSLINKGPVIKLILKK